jgi:microcystin-dependent protein
MFGGNFAPAGWAFCDGSIIAITANETLFSLIGTTYGGDGMNTFALPDLRGRVPIHLGSGTGGTYPLAQTGGAEQVTLTTSQMPAHSHIPQANSQMGTQTSPAGNLWANSANPPYSTANPSAALNPAAIGRAGGSQPHDNMLPFLVVNFIISLFGVYPSPT